MDRRDLKIIFMGTPEFAETNLKALDRNGNEFVLEADDLLARCICHENDHLNGVLFIDKSVDGKVYKTEDAED